MFLKLSPSKFHFIHFSRSSRLILSLPSINISFYLSLVPYSTIHSLGFTFDFSLSLIPQKKFVVKSSFIHLRRIKQLKVFLDNPTFKLLVSSLISSALYYGMPGTTLHQLTKAFNSAARLVSGLINSLFKLLSLSLYAGCLSKKDQFSKSALSCSI